MAEIANILLSYCTLNILLCHLLQKLQPESFVALTQPTALPTPTQFLTMPLLTLLHIVA